MKSDENDIAVRIGRLHDDAVRSTPAFQSVLAAVLRVLCDVRHQEMSAASAAISLGHRESLERLVEEIRSTIDALTTLSSRSMSAECPPPEKTSETWWYALAEATHSIESAVERLSALVASQPRGCAVRGLVSEVIRVLRTHHRLLNGEATRWIEG